LLYTNLMVLAALFSSENIYTLLTLFVTIEVSFDEGKKQMDLKSSKFLFSIKKGMKLCKIKFFTI
jgi:hypothetical protein